MNNKFHPHGERRRAVRRWAVQFEHMSSLWPMVRKPIRTEVRYYRWRWMAKRAARGKIVTGPPFSFFVWVTFARFLGRVTMKDRQQETTPGGNIHGETA